MTNKRELTPEDIKKMDRLDTLRVELSTNAQALERAQSSASELVEKRVKLEDNIDVIFGNLNGLVKGIGTEQFIEQRDALRVTLNEETLRLIDTITELHKRNVEVELLREDWKNIAYEKASLLHELGIID